ncbi:hypothetical protein MUK42_17777 [Musa troglodytarum]|uniref:LysM domain-containing protein n=1 Tax=Musa troglodytarum TaxID=320322 RepID=A0A9E7H9L0_9LILI|nr:hypothetical protein MUK42_17777 [Musa troglodytarum]
MRLLTVLFILQAIFAVGSDARSLRDGGGCAQLYVAEEGETLQTISVKCDDLFILDDNPHIVDSDDIGPGTVLHLVNDLRNRNLCLSISSFADVNVLDVYDACERNHLYQLISYVAYEWALPYHEISAEQIIQLEDSVLKVCENKEPHQNMVIVEQFV